VVFAATGLHKTPFPHPQSQEESLRKVVILVVSLVVVLATAITAVAQSGNSYGVEASVSPNKRGTKKKPVPTKVTFGYTVNGPDAATQPAAVRQYKIEFYGIRENGARFPTCSAESMVNAGKSDADCAAGSRMGTGQLQAVAYPSNDPRSSSRIDCNKQIRFYNAGNRKAVIFLTGDPNQCGGVGNFVIPATFVNGAGGAEAIQFTVANDVLHPAPGLTVAVRSVTTQINLKTKRVRGKRVGYFESVGCLGSNRPVRVTFTTEAGETARGDDSVLCRR